MTKLTVIEKATGKEVFDRKCSKRNAEYVKARLYRTMFNENDYEIAVGGPQTAKIEKRLINN